MGGSASKNKQPEAPAASSAASGRGRRAAGAQAQVTSKDKAILDLKNARDRLRKYQIRLDIEATQLHESAKRLLLADRRDHAKLALKLKKFKEQQMRKADEHLMQVLQMLDTVEWETQQMMVLEGLKAGNSILNEMHKEMTVEAVENLMLETEEAQATANEISRLIGGSLTVEDEDAVLSELAEIEAMEAAALAVSLPQAPTGIIETSDITIEAAPSKPAAPVKVRREHEKEAPIAILG